MSPILDCIINKNTKKKPVWYMRQAGRYLPEFREIRKKNQDFIKLCLNDNIVPEITLQPLYRFNLDAAIIFSDILMLPHGIGQKVEFKKDFGPILDILNLEASYKITESDFLNNLKPVYKSINRVSKNKILNNKDLIGFVGAPWTLLVYILNRKSPKKKIDMGLFSDEYTIKNLFTIIDKFLKIHIKSQINNGATIIQIFDSWAGLVDHQNLEKYIYKPTLSLVEFIKSLKTPVICFPRNIKNYKEYVNFIKPDVINIDYEVNIKNILNHINIPIQGGLDPKILLSENDNIKKNALKYLNAFKDHPYIFNLGHGILPETKPETVKYLTNLVKEF